MLSSRVEPITVRSDFRALVSLNRAHEQGVTSQRLLPIQVLSIAKLLPAFVGCKESALPLGSKSTRAVPILCGALRLDRSWAAADKLSMKRYHPKKGPTQWAEFSYGAQRPSSQPR